MEAYKYRELGLPLDVAKGPQQIANFTAENARH